MAQLPADCLNEIFEYLEDKVTLRSCLLVNRLWCEVAVRILWRIIGNMSFRTLIACLPNESKKILHGNGIIISAPTSKPPMFNYPAFCKVLSDYPVYCMIIQFFRQFNSFYSNENNTHIVEQEIHKLFMKQIYSLKTLSFWGFSDKTFCTYPGAKDCLKNLSELRCRSNTYPEIFYQLSQICHNIQSLSIIFSGDVISSGLKDLISVQKNLKRLSIVPADDNCNDFAEMIPSFTKLSDTLIKFSLCYDSSVHMPLSFITKFINLQELVLKFLDDNNEDFKDLQYVTFSQLRVLRIPWEFPRHELLIKFLENNGKNLREFYTGNDCLLIACDNSLNLSIAKFCQNLRKLSVGFKNDELETLKIVLNSCQCLESIKIWCGGAFLTGKDALEIFVKYSPKTIHELILSIVYDVYDARKLLPEELESCFISWTNRMPQKPLTLVIFNLEANNSYDENMKVIEKYIELGIIKFKSMDFDEENY